MNVKKIVTYIPPEIQVLSTNQVFHLAQSVHSEMICSSNNLTSVRSYYSEMSSVCSRIVGQPGTLVPGATISTGSEPGTHVPGAVSPAESRALTGWLVYFNSDNKRELGPMI